MKKRLFLLCLCFSLTTVALGQQPQQGGDLDGSAETDPIRFPGPSFGNDDCCVAHNTPGCDDSLCQAAVCAVDPFCCSVAWDGVCGGAALALCAVCNPDPTTCCLDNGTPGCEDPACQDTVCAADPFCCSVTWDGNCALAAVSACSVCDFCDCCHANTTPGCGAQACQDAICAVDAYCCSVSWDAVCAAEAGLSCDICNILIPATCDCCTANGSPGCTGQACEDVICAADPFCCDISWDGICATAALVQPACIDCCKAVVVPGECPVDNEPPSCALAFDAVSVSVSIQDAGSGLASILATVVENTNVDIPVFAQGTHDELLVYAEKIDPVLAAILELTVTDVAGNVTVCDPILTNLVIPGRSRGISETFIEVPGVEHYIQLENGSPGVREFGAIVNGTSYGPVKLQAGDKEMLDVVDAMVPGKNNTMTLRVTGWPGGQLLVLVSDTPVAPEGTSFIGGAISLPGPGEQMVDLTWGRTVEIGPSKPQQNVDATVPGTEQSSGLE